MSDSLEFELTDGERRHLLDMLKSPGYRVLDKIASSYIEAARETAIMASGIEPLENKDAIANKWAYVMMAEQFRTHLNKGIEFEVAVLQHGMRAAEQTPASLSKLRRQFAVLGELDEPPMGETE